MVQKRTAQRIALVALAASLLYVTFEFNYRLEKSAAPRAVAPLARVKNLND